MNNRNLPLEEIQYNAEKYNSTKFTIEKNIMLLADSIAEGVILSIDNIRKRGHHEPITHTGQVVEDITRTHTPTPTTQTTGQNVE